jgi:membrane protein
MFRRSWNLLRRTFSEFSEDRGLQIAAALSYYTVFSLAPLLVLILSIAALVWDEQEVRNRVTGEFGSVVGAEGAAQVQTMIDAAGKRDGSVWGTLVGGGLLVLGATGVMMQLQDALNQIWDVEPRETTGGVIGMLLKRVLSLGLILAITFLLLVSLMATTLLSALGERLSNYLPSEWTEGAVHLANIVVTYTGTVLLFAMLMKYLPDRDIRWRDVLPGAAVTALLFAAAKWGLGMYLAHSDVASAYGAAGSLALILLWVYYNGAVFLFGAEFTQVWTRRGEPEARG